ncbi:leucyl aminopeptidase, partial [Salinisphaera aquimarina]
RDFNARSYRRACEAAGKKLDNMGGVDAAFYLTELNVKGRDDFGWQVKQALLTVEDVFYRFEACRGPDHEKHSRKLARLIFQVPRRSDLPAAERGVDEGVATANGVKFAKDLGNMPGNICTPTYLAEQAVALSERQSAVKTNVLEEADMEALGMGALLGVSRGSRQPAKLIVMEYMNGPKNAKPIVLVGKGVTFDAGGISLKP